MSMFSENSSIPAKPVVDNVTYTCEVCASNDIYDSVRQYYVNLDSTANMCSICKGAYLSTNQLKINDHVKSSISRKSMKKMMLLPFLLNESDRDQLTQKDAMELLEGAFSSYNRTMSNDNKKWNEFLSLAGQLFPNQVKSEDFIQRETFSNAIRESRWDMEEVFYFDKGLQIKKETLTPDEIEAVLLSCINFEEETPTNYEMDAFEDFSVPEITPTIPILSDETLLSPILFDNLKKYNDTTLKALNENQDSGIKINIDFSALQQMLSPPSSSSQPCFLDQEKIVKFHDNILSTIVSSSSARRKSQLAREEEEMNKSGLSALFAVNKKLKGNHVLKKSSKALEVYKPNRSMFLQNSSIDYFALGGSCNTFAENSSNQLIIQNEKTHKFFDGFEFSKFDRMNQIGKSKKLKKVKERNRVFDHFSLLKKLRKR